MENKHSTRDKLLDYGFKALLIAGAIYGINKIIKNYQKTSTESKADEKPEVRQAMTIYSSMNPSGMEWMRKMDGTNTEIIFKTAKEIADLDKVQSAYRKLYNSSMLDDLRQELSPQDYTRFLNTLRFSTANINKEANKPKLEYKKGTPLATKLESNIRRTPKNISKWSFDSNIITLASSGKYIGFATGKSEFDNSGSETGTLYIEIQSVTLDTRKPVYFWVAASQLEIISDADYKARKYPFFFLKEKDVLNGFDGSEKRVISFCLAPIMDDKFKQVGMVTPFTLLGFSVMELTDKKGNGYVKFKTNNHKQYWINKRFAHISRA